MVAAVVWFVCLQLLDLVSTLAFLRLGIKEANPVVRGFIWFFGEPWIALAYAKAFAIALLMICVGQGRRKLLFRVTIFYTGLAVWNLYVIYSHLF